MARLQILCLVLLAVSQAYSADDRIESMSIDQVYTLLSNSSVRSARQIYFPRIRNFFRKIIGRKDTEEEISLPARLKNNRPKKGPQAQLRYDGAQLWQVGPLDQENEYVVQVLEEVFGASVWRSTDQQTDIFLERSAVSPVKQFLKQNKLQYQVLINDVQKIIDEEQTQFRSEVEMNWNEYHDFKVIEAFLKDVSSRHPRITELITIGRSNEKRPLYVMKIGNGHPDNSAIWIDGGIHAREWISPAAVTYIINQLAEFWHDFPEHIRRRDWYIMPVVNPDGYEYSRHFDRLWRKNRKNHGKGCYGVDLNRNFDYEWGDEDIDFDPCSDVYRGPEPLSEPESQAIVNFTMRLDPRPSVFLTYHSYGQLIVYPWAHKLAVPKDHEVLKAAAQKAIRVIKKITGSKYITFPAHQISGPEFGGSDDWAKGALGADLVYTVELGDTGVYGFLLPPKLIRIVSTEAMIIARVMSQVLG